MNSRLITGLKLNLKLKMPFRFRLKSLLRHREFKLREAQAALGAAEAVRMRIQSTIERLGEEFAWNPSSSNRNRKKESRRPGIFISRAI